jgi:hypothetical protein
LQGDAPLPLTKQQHLDPRTGPKRILALDGGGIRGILTLQFLQSLESLIKARFGDKTLLCDYFDLIGGTSTGSIIAAGLACGMTVDALQTLYRNIGASVFQQGTFSRLLPGSLQGTLAPKFPAGPLQAELDRQLGADTTLDSAKIRTGLMIMTKRLDTGSPWPLNNSGHGQYAAQDGALRLSQVVRASTAAPTYFAPEEIAIHARDGSVVNGAFVDGGVTPFNDPALQLLMLAALQGHGFLWPTGKDRLLIVSIGTGAYKQPRSAKDVVGDVAAKQGIAALQSLMDDCERTTRATLQWLTNCLTPWIIDRAVGDMKLDSQSGPQLATYVRYNAILEQAWLKTELGVDLAGDKLDQIRKMDDPSNMNDLADLGRKAAAKQVKPEHLPAPFDLATASV